MGERGEAGSGMVFQPGFELGTPKAQQRFMSAHYPALGTDIKYTFHEIKIFYRQYFTYTTLEQ